MDFLKNYLDKSIWVMTYNSSSCGGCDIEIINALSPAFTDTNIKQTSNPKHADVLLITGVVNQKNKQVVKNLYEMMPSPKAVVAVGACACTGGIFRENKILTGIEEILPVDEYIRRCCPDPQEIIDGITRAVQKISSKSNKKENSDKNE